jgi:hypothetical protein
MKLGGLFGEGRHRQDQALALRHLAIRHPDRGRREQGVGRLGAGAGCAPARACIEALLQGPEKKVEIQITAAKQWRTSCCIVPTRPATG